MERLTIPDVRIDEKTKKITIIDSNKVRENAMEIYWHLKEIEDILGADYDLDRLRELVEADRDRRCVVLPVKVGDTVYDTTIEDITGEIGVMELSGSICDLWKSGCWKKRIPHKRSRRGCAERRSLWRITPAVTVCHRSGIRGVRIFAPGVPPGRRRTKPRWPKPEESVRLPAVFISREPMP